MKSKRKQLVTLISISVFIMMTAFVNLQDQVIGPPWVIPDEYKNKENPYKEDSSLKMVGLRTYNRHCRSCHGTTGKGDGVMAKNLKTFSGDFTSEQFRNFTDGEIYYQSIIGRDEMPNYEKLIPDEEDRWAVVNHIRTLKK
jgi:mono/diheme cytochrome c family protein